MCECACVSVYVGSKAPTSRCCDRRALCPAQRPLSRRTFLAVTSLPLPVGKFGSLEPPDLAFPGTCFYSGETKS